MTLGVTSLLSPASDHRLRTLTDALATAGHAAGFIDGPWQDRFDAMRDGSAPVGWLCGLLHVELSSHGDWPYRAVAARRSTRNGSRGDPVYFGDVVVSGRSDVQDFRDLRGSTFAYNETASLSGYRMMIDHLGSGDTDLSFFSATVASGSHSASMRLVADGEADCAIIDSTLIDDGVAGTHELRTLVSVGPYPAPPLVAAPGLEDLLRAAAISRGWTGVDDDDYSTLRAAL
ncbi:MAG: PhnD/SsuA/transferrin family substrate-binding protein [Acidimicrobiia bacterium]